MSRIFLSHSSLNNAEAIAIRDWMNAQGWNDVFLDLDAERGLVAGDRWQAALKDGGNGGNGAPCQARPELGVWGTDEWRPADP
jgi:hypothetical protein